MCDSFVWARGRAAVSLSFDDAAVSQFKNALPLLDRYQIRGTFYVNPDEGGVFERHIDVWRKVHKNGHELGNHTMTHPCSGNFPFIVPSRALENWTLERIA